EVGERGGGRVRRRPTRARAAAGRGEPHQDRPQRQQHHNPATHLGSLAAKRRPEQLLWISTTYVLLRRRTVTAGGRGLSSGHPNKEGRLDEDPSQYCRGGGCVRPARRRRRCRRRG